MDFFAATNKGVHIYSYTPGQNEEPEADFNFPAVNTADGLEWSSDGTMLGLVDPSSGGVAVYNAADGYKKLCEVPPLIGGPVRNFYFSPLGNHLITHERWAKDAGANVGVWNAKTGELRFSFILKKLTEMTWPPLKWTALETHCCRMVADGVQIMPGSCDKEGETVKINAPGIMAFEVAPRAAGNGSVHCAICIAEAKGAPARCQIFRLDNPTAPTATKNFFKAQTVTMTWNHMGTALLCKASMEVDDTGKSYYGGSNLYFVRADGEEAFIVAPADGGALHDYQWSPTQDEFVLLHGQLPCPATLHEGRKGQKRMDFGTSHRNTIRWNNFGKFFVLGGYGQLLGDTDFWDKGGKQNMGSTRMECCVVCGWAPDGRHFLTATTHPRMRVDNKIQIFDYVGKPLGTLRYDELLLAGWRPRPRGAFQDRPPSPERIKGAAAKAKAQAKSDPAKQAYRPPGARGGGGLSELLRKELGSTAGESSGTATKAGAAKQQGIPGYLPPGVSPDDFASKTPGSSSTASRNARKKKAKEAAQAGGEQEQQEKFEPPKREAPKAAPAASAPAAAAGGGGGGGGENSEVEKRVRALRKKLRDIEKLKAQDGPLDPLQKQKIEGEGELIRQIRELGAEP